MENTETTKTQTLDDMIRRGITLSPGITLGGPNGGTMRYLCDAPAVDGYARRCRIHGVTHSAAGSDRHTCPACDDESGS